MFISSYETIDSITTLLEKKAIEYVNVVRKV